MSSPGGDTGNSSFVDDYLAENGPDAYTSDHHDYSNVHNHAGGGSKNSSRTTTATKKKKNKSKTEVKDEFDFEEYEMSDLDGLLSSSPSSNPSSSALFSQSSSQSSSCSTTRCMILSMAVMGAMLGVRTFLDYGAKTVIVNDDDFQYIDEHSLTQSSGSSSSVQDTNHGTSQHKHEYQPDERPNDLSLAHHAQAEELGMTSYHYANLANINTDPYDDLMDTPIFFHIPRSGGTTLEHVLGQCLGLIQASQVGTAIEDHAHASDTELQVLSTFNNEYLYVNVDTTNVEGLHHAKDLGLAESQMADVVYTEFIYDAAGILFTEHHRGRLFTIMRHPVDRAVSMYYYLRKATWETTYDHTLQTYTLEEYAQKGQTEHNWMTRMLSSAGNGQLFPKHLDMAKQVLADKALIGLLDKFDESIERFEQYFGWDDLLLQSAAGENDSPILKKHAECQQTLLNKKINGQSHSALDRDSDTWIQLQRRNWFDVELYNFAEELFNNQTRWFESK